MSSDQVPQEAQTRDTFSSVVYQGRGLGPAVLCSARETRKTQAHISVTLYNVEVQSCLSNIALSIC